MRSLQSFFKTSIFASGTPSNYQRKIKDQFSEYAIEVPLFTSVKNNWVIKPTFNLIECAQTNFVNAIAAVLKNELTICKNPRLIVNCRGIDETKDLRENDFFANGMGKDFHVIAIHSIKEFQTEDGKDGNVFPSIDGNPMNARDVMEDIQQKLDNNEMFNDNLPIILLQVDMISEGLNVKSFSSCIITTDSDQKAMQQIGRTIRLYEGKETANVYFMYDNFEKIVTLKSNLDFHYLTESCFDWGKKYIPPTGSGSNSDDGEAGALNKFEWESLSKNLPYIRRIEEGVSELNTRIERKEEKANEAFIDGVKRLYWQLWEKNLLTIEDDDLFSEIIASDEFLTDPKVASDLYKRLSKYSDLQ